MIVDETTGNPSRPFFLYLAYDTPHAALQLPTVEYPTGKGVGGGLQWNGISNNMINTATGTIDSYVDPLYSGRDWPDTHERIATMVTRIDHCVGDILQTLEDLNIADNTIVVFSSDNGPHKESYISGANYAPTAFQSYGPFEGIKEDCYEGGSRMPTFAWGPSNVVGGVVNHAPSQFHDWMPTFCDYAGITAPARTDGVSLVPTLSGSGTQQVSTVYIEYNPSGSMPTYADFPNHGGTSRKQSQAIYLDGYKGIRNNIGSHAADFRIYDTLTDLAEGTNLAGTTAYFIDLQQRMKDKVLRIRQPNSSASRPYDSELVPPVAAAVENGLEVKTYEGSWSWVPEFEEMVHTGTNAVTGISTAHLSRSTDAGLLYTGFIKVPADGTWTFYNTSDEGIILRIHDSLVNDDDFNHTGAEKSGTIKLKAGLHPFRLYYRTAASAPVLNFKWEGPGTAKAEIPDSALFRPGNLPPGPPVATDDSAVTAGSTSVLINALANDFDDGTPAVLSITEPGHPLAGTAVLESGQIRYTPNAGFFGTDRFPYTISDGQDSTSGTIAVEVYVAPVEPWFPLNESSGRTVAEAGGFVAGTHSGFADSEAAHIVGQYGNALTFDGVDDQVNLSGITLPSGSSARTVSAWVRVSATSGVELQTFFGYGQNNTGQRFSCRLDTATPANQRLRLEVSGGFITGTTTINDGSWHHVAVVVDDFNGDDSVNVNEARLYVDGLLEPISSAGARVINTSASGIPVIGGSSHADNHNFKGDIDEVQIFNSAKTGPEIAALAGRTVAQADGSLWFYRNLGNAEPTVNDWNTDGNGDGYSHYLVYALGGSPHWFESSMLPYLESGPGRLDYYYNRRLALDPTGYVPESTTNLVDPAWLPVAGAIAAPHPELDDYEVVVTEISTTETNRFIRLRISMD